MIATAFLMIFLCGLIIWISVTYSTMNVTRGILFVIIALLITAMCICRRLAYARRNIDGTPMPPTIVYNIRPSINGMPTNEQQYRRDQLAPPPYGLVQYQMTPKSRQQPAPPPYDEFTNVPRDSVFTSMPNTIPDLIPQNLVRPRLLPLNAQSRLPVLPEIPRRTCMRNT